MNKKIKYLLDYFKLLKNPVSCLLFKFNVIHNVEVKFKGSNETVYLNKNSVINDLMGMLQYQDNITSEFIDFINALNSKNKIISGLEGIFLIILKWIYLILMLSFLNILTEDIGVILKLIMKIVV